MNDEEIEKIGDIAGNAVKAALKSEILTEQSIASKEAEYDTIVSHGKKYVELKARSVVTIIDELNKVFHSPTHDFLSCPVCRPLFESKINEMGYSITITKKQQITRSKRMVRKSPNR